MRGFLLVFLFIACALNSEGAEVYLDWKAQAGQTGYVVEGYKVYVGTAMGKPSKYVDVGTDTSCVARGLEKGRTYYFHVTAYNKAGESISSNVIKFTVSK